MQRELNFNLDPKPVLNFNRYIRCRPDQAAVNLHYQALKNLAGKRGLQVIDDKPFSQEDRLFSGFLESSGLITINPDRPELDQVRTLAHEIAHDQLKHLKSALPLEDQQDQADRFALKLLALVGRKLGCRIWIV